ncbi:hypothetical protein [Deinococcus aluminii]|uniref:Uncharacterized protein n=1 Tax=Deinococcus aluminii TaxID=1656885 RepID=A0ABP9XDP8_9DEIO
MKALLVGLVLSTLGVGFVAGRSSVSAPAGGGVTAVPRPMTVQAQNDPRELIPLTPRPGDAPGQGQQPRPGQGACTVLMFKDGQFYQLQPGTPGPGGEQPGGQPGGDGELFPLQPFQAPGPLPGLPLPQPDVPLTPPPDLRV